MDAFDSVIGSDSKVRDGVDAAIRKVEGCQICVCFKLDLLLLLFCVAELFTDCGRRRLSDGTPPRPRSLINYPHMRVFAYLVCGGRLR